MEDVKVDELKKKIAEKNNAELQELNGKIADLLKQYNADFAVQPFITQQGTISATIGLVKKE